MENNFNFGIEEDNEGGTYVLRHITFSVPDTYEIHKEDELAFKAVARNVSVGKAQDFVDRDGKKLFEMQYTRPNVPTYEIMQNGVCLVKLMQPSENQIRLKGEGSAGKYIVDVEERRENTKSYPGYWTIRDENSVKLANMRINDKFNATYTIMVEPGTNTKVILGLCVMLSESIGFGPLAPRM